MSAKALYLKAAQGEYKVEDKPIPKPGAGELLVKITATALNPVDWKIQAYNIFISEYPAILGTDSAGVVEAVGEGVTGFAKGDEVFHQGFFTNDKATFQQYTLVPAEITAKKPSKISFDEAASIPLTLATAAAGLYNTRSQEGIQKLTPPWEKGGEGAYSGKAILIAGGSSSVGQYAIQLARLSGFSPIITTASPRNADLLKSLGATHVIDRSKDVAAEVAAISKSVGIVFDTISEAGTQAAAWDALAQGGVLILTLPPTVDRSKYADKKVVDDLFGNVHAPHVRALGVSLYAALPNLLETGALKPNRVETVPGGLAGIPAGLDKLKAGVSGVKLIAHPWD